MISRYILALLSAFPMQTYAQQLSETVVESIADENDIAGTVMAVKVNDSTVKDSLHSIDTLSVAQEARLFLPMTFYRGIAKRMFSLDEKADSMSESVLDNALLNIYLKRPDLVTIKESTLDSTGGPIERAPTTIAPIIEKVNKDTVTTENRITAPTPEIVVLKPNFWKFKGDYYLQFLQNYVSDNWYKGGEKNYSMMASVVFEANYNNKQKVRWDNKLEMKVGLQTSPSDTVHKVKTNTDMLRLTSRLGLQATKKWYYTIQAVANTQMFRNYGSNSKNVLSDFMSPVNLNVSIGMDYKPSWFKGKLTGNVHLAPLAYNLKYVDRKVLNTRYGIEKERQALNDFGSQFTIDMSWTFSDMIKWTSRLYGYTTYERAEMEWENTFTFKFNKYITSMLYIYPRFDDARKKDKDYGYFQLKEYVSFGFSYSM